MKVTGCCAQAMLDGWEYVVGYLSTLLEGSNMSLLYTSWMSWHSKTFQVNHKLYQWIDSCCIDKSSSAELSEAINSMFRWYEESQVCYAYLSDVRNASEDPSSRDSDFLTSKWFTRGWTLQELLAPHCKYRGRPPFRSYPSDLFWWRKLFQERQGKSLLR